MYSDHVVEEKQIDHSKDNAPLTSVCTNANEACTKLDLKLKKDCDYMASLISALSQDVKYLKDSIISKKNIDDILARIKAIEHASDKKDSILDNCDELLVKYREKQGKKESKKETEIAKLNSKIESIEQELNKFIKFTKYSTKPEFDMNSIIPSTDGKKKVNQHLSYINCQKQSIAIR